ncbi:MAG: hypothetical protein HW404_1391 [Anaerolineales bacterium]|nr:hypothetical protein [Anaerolineales bacterium]
MRIARSKDKRFTHVWPIALAGFALAAAGLACSASSLGGGSSKDYTALFDAPANPSSVRPELDPSGASHALISAAGGTIEATGPDGTRFMLSVPEGALPLAVEISLTPLRQITDLPLDDLGGAVVIGPVDLQFHEIATLTIEPALDIPLAEQITFGFEAEGGDFHLQPPGADPETVQVLVLRSGGFGVGRAAAGERQALLDHLPTSPANRFAHQLADVLLRARQQGLSTGIEGEAQSLVAAYYDAFVRRVEAGGEPAQSRVGHGGSAMAVPPAQPHGATAVGCDEARELFELGLQKKYLEELGINEGEGFTVPPDDLVLQLAEACLAEAHEDCVADDNLTRLPTEYLNLWLLGELGLASDAALAQVTTIARGLMEKCYRFDLEMTSIITVKEEGTGGFESVMTAKIPLRLKPVADLANAIVFSELEVFGSGVLYNESMTFEVAPGGCTITGVRGGGEFAVIKLPLILGSDGLTEVNLTYHPGDSTEGGTVSCPQATTSDMPTGGYWSSSYLAMHVDDLSMTSDAGALSGMLAIPYLARDWELLGGEEVARKEYVRSQAPISEDTTFTLIHTPAP